MATESELERAYMQGFADAEAGLSPRFSRALVADEEPIGEPTLSVTALIGELGLPVRIQTLLRGLTPIEEPVTIADLTAKTESELLDIEGFGGASLTLVKRALAEAGYRLKRG